jgi:hypothetical protein
MAREKVVIWTNLGEKGNTKGLIRQIEERESSERLKAHLLKCKTHLKEWRE